MPNLNKTRLLLLFIIINFVIPQAFLMHHVAAQQDYSIIRDKVYYVQSPYYDISLVSSTTPFFGNGTILGVSIGNAAQDPNAKMLYAFSYNAFQDIFYQYTRWNRGENTSLIPKKIVTLGDTGFALVIGDAYQGNDVNVFLLSLDLEMVPYWRITWGDPKINETVIDAVSTVGSVYVLGEYENVNYKTLFILKYDVVRQLPSETVRLDKVIKLNISSNAVVKSIAAFSSMVFIAGNYITDNSSFVLKVSASTGQVMWNKKFSAYANIYVFNDIAIYDNLLLVAGYQSDAFDNTNALIWIIDATDGHLVNESTAILFDGKSKDIATSICVDKYGVAYIAGYTIGVSGSDVPDTKDVFLLRFDTNNPGFSGLEKVDVWGYPSKDNTKVDDIGVDVAVDSDHGIIFVVGDSHPVFSGHGRTRISFILVYGYDNNGNGIADFKEAIGEGSNGELSTGVFIGIPSSFDWVFIMEVIMVVLIIALGVALYILIFKK